jgi:hypothetical protein
MISGAAPKARLKLLASAIVALAMALATASRAAETPWGLSQLIPLLLQETKSSVNFSEERHLAFLTEPVVLEGRLSFEPSGRLERLVLSPKRERMIIDGRLLIIETNAKDPPIRVLLSDHPPLEAFVVALRSLLAGDQGALEQIYDTNLAGGQASWQLRLTPHAPQLSEAVVVVQIKGAADTIESIEVVETGGNRSVITLGEKK